MDHRASFWCKQGRRGQSKPDRRTILSEDWNSENAQSVNLLQVYYRLEEKTTVVALIPEKKKNKTKKEEQNFQKMKTLKT